MTRFPMIAIPFVISVGMLLMSSPVRAGVDLVVAPPDHIDFRELFLDRDGTVIATNVAPPDSLEFREPFIGRDGMPLETVLEPRRGLDFRERFVGREGAVLLDVVERPTNVDFRELFISRDGEVLQDQVDPPDDIDYRPPFIGRGGTITSVEGGPPTRRIEQARAIPNPFNPSTRISFRLHQQGDTSVAVYDTRGRLVRVLHEGELTADLHVLSWDGRDDSGDVVASGLYVFRIASVDEVVVVKGTLIK